jgi:hypothetical protein
MKNPATYEDAQIIMKLYELRREEKIREARKWIGSMPPLESHEHFLKLCPPGSDENAYFRMVTGYWTMAASFITSGVLNRELFYRSNNNELLFLWEKIRAAVPDMREKSKNPSSYTAIEEVANGFIDFWNEHAPGFYENFSAMVRKR